MNTPIPKSMGFHRGPHAVQYNLVLICIYVYHIFIDIYYRLQQDVAGHNEVPFTHLACLKNLLNLF